MTYDQSETFDIQKAGQLTPQQGLWCNFGRRAKNLDVPPKPGLVAILAEV